MWHSNEDDTDEQLSEIQNNIHHIERRIRMADSEKKMDVESMSAEMKKNDLEIKQLMMQVRELEVKKRRSQKVDEKVIDKEFRQRSRELGKFKGKSAKEAINLADAEVLELDKKCKALEQELRVLKRAFVSSEKQLMDMETKCNEDFENDPTEFDSLQRLRELENEQQKVTRDNIECEVAQSRYKIMKEQLIENQQSYPVLMYDVEREYEAQQAEVSLSELNDVDSPQMTSTNKSKVQPKIGEGDAGINCSKETSRAKKKSAPVTHEEVKSGTTSTEQQAELREMHKIFNRIKEVTHASDIQDAERRFLVQKSMEEDLVDLKRRLAKSLNELRSQMRQLNSRMALIKGANHVEPKREMSDEIERSKTRYEEQEKRRIDAKIELEKLTNLLTEVEARERKLLDALEECFPDVEVLHNELTASEICKKIEEILKEKLREPVAI